MLKSFTTNFSGAAVRRTGQALVLLGVLVWVPFIVLRVMGETPSVAWFLPFHLLGVIGGSRLKKLGQPETPANQGTGRLKKLGHGLILLGVLVWAPYFYLKYSLGQPVELMLFLPFHLAGVFSGLLVLAIRYVRLNRERSE